VECWVGTGGSRGHFHFGTHLHQIPANSIKINFLSNLFTFTHKKSYANPLNHTNNPNINNQIPAHIYKNLQKNINQPFQLLNEQKCKKLFVN